MVPEDIEQHVYSAAVWASKIPRTARSHCWAVKVAPPVSPHRGKGAARPGAGIRVRNWLDMELLRSILYIVVISVDLEEEIVTLSSIRGFLRWPRRSLRGFLGT